MPGIQKSAFLAISAIVAGGTLYSIAFNTYLDTSNPLLSHLPHPSSSKSYWARKSNWLNVYFIKFAWGWTSAAFLLSWLTSPPVSRSPQRLLKWFIETGCWMIFTNWFFGPAVIDRIVLASGGECVVTVPGGQPLTLPTELCYQKGPISYSTHPGLFTTDFAPPEWRGIPRLRKGHDVSGHIFLLTMSVLFLAEQLRSSFRLKSWSTPHSVAVVANVALILLWLFASYMTSVYFHSPSEKVSGYLLGLASYAVTGVPSFLGLA